MDIRKALYKAYVPTQRFIAPTLRYSQYFYEDILKSYVGPDTEWLDIGCGHQVLPAWRLEEEKQLVENCKTIVGIDYDLDSLKNHESISLKAKGDITKLPFRDECFDLVTANMVVEHLDRPDLQFQEVNRVLKPGGIFIFHTPNALSYLMLMGRLVPEMLKGKLIYLLERREEQDVFVTYYRANTREKIRSLAGATGFDVERIKMLVTNAAFQYILPLAIPELIWIRILMAKPFKPLRTNIIAVLRKQQNGRKDLSANVGVRELAAVSPGPGLGPTSSSGGHNHG